MLPAEENSPCAQIGNGNKIDLIAVAEQTGEATSTGSFSSPYYLAYDGGYLELGSSVAGIRPPAADRVGHALREALDSAGFQIATTQNAPSIMLAYHYGNIRPDKYSQANLRISTNQRARLGMVSTTNEFLRAQDYLAYQTNSSIATTAPQVRDSLDFANDARHFMIVSAYSYSQLLQQKPELLWRVKLSTAETNGSADKIIPALARATAPYLGRGFSERQYGSAEYSVVHSKFEGVQTVAPFILPRKAVEKIPTGVLRNLVLLERTKSSKQRQQPLYGNLSPELAKKISAYQNERAALQEALSARLRTTAPGENSHRAIDAFNQEFATRILKLGETGETIRSELSRLSLNEANAPGKSLDLLLKEFSASIHELEIKRGAGLK